MAMHDNPLFSTAADFVNNTCRHIFLTGKAGTGKTTFLRYIREHTRKKCVVVAPTGVAAINAGGVTMHSFFQLPLGPFLPVTHRFSSEGFTDQYTLFKNIRISDEKRELFRGLELLIIDEVSMVRCDMLDAVDAILRYFRKRADVPFGGVQVLYIGDLFQLPPVMPDAQWALLRQYYSSPFFFDSKAVEQAPPVYIELKKIYRQSQQRFIDVLNRVRNNEVTQEDLELLNARRGAEPEPGKKYITLTTHNYKADAINAEELKRLDGTCIEFRGQVEGDFPEKNLPTDAVLQLKAGAQVMFIRNDKSDERRYYNGKLATVKTVNNDSVSVVLDGSEEELVVEKETWNNIRYSYNKEQEQIDEEKLGSFTQYPIRLAWAITIHKSQGLTFQHAIIDAGESFAPGQVYVALSRCTSLDGLVLRSRITQASISTDQLVIEFARREAGTDVLADELQKAKLEYQHAQMAEKFNLEDLRDMLLEYTQYLGGKRVPDPEHALDAARGMLREIDTLQNIALKFQDQMKTLVDSGDEEKLFERVGKAIEYFSKALRVSVLNPLDQQIESLKGARKVKQYVRYLRRVRNSVARKINAIQKVAFGDLVFNPDAPEIPPIPEKVREKRRGSTPRPREEVSASLKETLSLLKAGMKPSEVAGKRGLALSTIEQHMGVLVKSGRLDIYQCVEAAKVDQIVRTIREIEAAGIKPVRQKLGDDFSYGEIQAVWNHLQYVENK